MLLAQLHGKLSRPEEDSEDLLTSNVFGALRYSGRLDVLCRFLAGAVARRGSGAGLPLGEVTCCEYRFWPWLPVGDGTGCEPDLVLLFEHPGGLRSLVAIEAKYMSGKSSHATPAGPVTDQLAREWLAARAEAERLGCARFQLVYLTADMAAPAGDIDAALRELHDKQAVAADIAWLSWRRLPQLLETCTEPILADLASLLRRAMLVWFEGVDLPRALFPPPYFFAAGASATATTGTTSTTGETTFAWTPLTSALPYSFDPAPAFLWPSPRLPHETSATAWRFTR